MDVIDNKKLAIVLFILHVLLSAFMFTLYMQPEPPEVVLCLGIIPFFVLLYAAFAWRPSSDMQRASCDHLKAKRCWSTTFWENCLLSAVSFCLYLFVLFYLQVDEIC